MILLCTACHTNKRDFIPYTNKRDWSKPNGYYVGISESESVERGFYKNGEKIGWWFGYSNTHKLYFVSKYKPHVGMVFYGTIDTFSNKLQYRYKYYYSKFKNNNYCQVKWIQYYPNGIKKQCVTEIRDSLNILRPYIEIYYDSLGSQTNYYKNDFRY